MTSPRLTSPNAGRAQRGFSLIEILAVLMLIAMIVSVTAISVGGSLTGAEVRNAHRDITAGLRQTRGQAIFNSTPAFFEVEVEERRWKAAGRDWVVLPEGMEIRLLTVESELTGDNSGRIRFFADGSSSGGRVTLSHGDREWRVGVAWLTGEIALEDDSSANAR